MTTHDTAPQNQTDGDSSVEAYGEYGQAAPMAFSSMQRLQRTLENPSAKSLTPDTIMRFQKLYGNQQTLKWVQRAGLPANDTIQRDPPIEMEPMTVRGDPGGNVEDVVSNLDELRGQGDTDSDITMSHSQESVDRNSPEVNQPLPYNESGWDSTAILNTLGQHDRLAGTDSDGVRCVQAVAMASYIPNGPDAVASYLNSISFDALLSTEPSDRQQAAMRVIELVRDRLRRRTATYRDLSWAQEAVHDLFNDDFSGTDPDAIQSQVTPTLEGMNRNTRTVDIWCTTPAQVMEQVNALPPGGQLLINEWTVIFNSAFDQLSDEEGYNRQRVLVEINGRRVWIRRIDASTRPSHTDISVPSDKKSGHQLLIMKPNVADDPPQLYEPEITASGNHLQTLSENGTELAHYLREDTTNGIYGYIQIIGIVTPQQTLTPGLGADSGS